MTKKSDSIILGIDPGYAIVGYGIIAHRPDNRIVATRYGAITTSAKLPLMERLLQIHDQLSAIISETKPSAVGLEKLYFAKNAKTAMDVGQARGVILLTCMQHGLPVYEFTPMQVKQAVCGYGGADKKQIQKMVQLLLNLKTTPKPDDVADALAIAISCLHALPTLSRLRAQ